MVGLELIGFMLTSWIIQVHNSIETPVNYNGDKVIRVWTESNEDWLKAAKTLELITGNENLDVWKSWASNSKYADVLLQYKHYLIFEASKTNFEFSHQVIIDNVQRLIDRSSQSRKRHRKGTRGATFTEQYHRYDDIVSWMEAIADRHPSMAKVISIGQSYKGIETKVLKLGNCNQACPSVWIDAGIHAREWIAPAVALYIINQLIEEYEKQDTNKHKYLNVMEWYILPVVNPDGYEYTFTNDRLWRKNRRPINNDCIGVDLNRNFGFHWGGVNASPQPCNSLYHGPEANSEKEVQNMVNFILAHKESMKVYITLHSYAQTMFVPWAYSSEIKTDDHKELVDLASKTVSAMNSIHQKEYEAGLPGDILYPFSGGSADWAKGVAGIKYSYLLELRDTGLFGFLLPSWYIIPTGEEVWAGLKVIVNETLKKYGNISDIYHTNTTSNTKVPPSGSFESNQEIDNRDSSKDKVRNVYATALPSEESTKPVEIYNSSISTYRTSGNDIESHQNKDKIETTILDTVSKEQNDRWSKNHTPTVFEINQSHSPNIDKTLSPFLISSRESDKKVDVRSVSVRSNGSHFSHSKIVNFLCVITWVLTTCIYVH